MNSVVIIGNDSFFLSRLCSSFAAEGLQADFFDYSSDSDLIGFLFSVKPGFVVLSFNDKDSGIFDVVYKLKSSIYLLGLNVFIVSQNKLSEIDFWENREHLNYKDFYFIEVDDGGVFFDNLFDRIRRITTNKIKYDRCIF